MFKNYTEARAEAQKRANETGYDYRVEHNKLYNEWNIGMLPARAHRYGHEATFEVEVVSCEIWDKIRPGHGPK